MSEGYKAKTDANTGLQVKWITSTLALEKQPFVDEQMAAFSASKQNMSWGTTLLCW